MTGPQPAQPATPAPAQQPSAQQAQPDPKLVAELNKLSTTELVTLDKRVAWLKSRHKHQCAPQGKWTVWLLLAGRGAGKTRAAAEWLWWQAYQRPETRWLVCAPTSADIRDTCFEGDSGLIFVMPDKIVKEYNRSF